eukprot:scaffold426_cov319-Pavlova_lutheri.AAC.8
MKQQSLSNVSRWSTAPIAEQADGNVQERYSLFGERKHKGVAASKVGGGKLSLAIIGLIILKVLYAIDGQGLEFPHRAFSV